MTDFTWTVDEIHSCLMFGTDVAWFYGIVRTPRGPRLAEIFPGMGYCSVWPLKPAGLTEALADVRLTPRRKAAYVGRRSVQQQAVDAAVIERQAEDAVENHRVFDGQS